MYSLWIVVRRRLKLISAGMEPGGNSSCPEDGINEVAVKEKNELNITIGRKSRRIERE